MAKSQKQKAGSMLVPAARERLISVRRGLEAFDTLKAEEADLVKFLTQQGVDPDAAAPEAAADAAAPRSTSTRLRRTLSQEQRDTISRRMKAVWRKRRKAQEQPEAEASEPSEVSAASLLPQQPSA